MSVKIAVVLSGCGVYDGTEIHESVLTLLALARAKVEVSCLAPNINQHHVIDHTTGEEMQETRNVLVESARICRGEISPLEDADPTQFDAVIFPGGFGAAKNLSTFGTSENSYDIPEIVSKFVQAFHKEKKPIGMLCISPVIAAKALGMEKVQLTIGNDTSLVPKIEQYGAEHVRCDLDDVVFDEENLLVSSPAYMLASNIVELQKGINRLVDFVVSLATDKK